MSSANDGPSLADLKQLQWQNRVLVLWSEDAAATLAALSDQYSTAIEERDLILVVLGADTLETNFEGSVDEQLGQGMREAFPKSKGHYFLLGKDGGLKQSGDSLDIEAVFDLIDSMPMRVQEMRSEP